jgi:hypothetical protein
VSASGDVQAVLLTGTIGAGKTALAIEAGEILGRSGLGVAVIDLDWLGWFHPPAGSSHVTPADLIVRNLAAVWANLRAAGARFAVLARMVQEPGEIEGIRSALEGATLTVVRVEASAPVIEARLRRRDTGAELAEHLAEVARVGRALDALHVEDWRITNGDAPVAVAAAELLDRLGWI